MFHEDTGRLGAGVERGRGVRRLWAQALIVAVRDATMATDKPERREARAFLTLARHQKDRHWFDLACDLGGGTVCRIGKTLEESGWKKIEWDP